MRRWSDISKTDHKETYYADFIHYFLLSGMQLLQLHYNAKLQERIEKRLLNVESYNFEKRIQKMRHWE